jgi:hypothetical protein
MSCVPLPDQRRNDNGALHTLKIQYSALATDAGMLARTPVAGHGR